MPSGIRRRKLAKSGANLKVRRHARNKRNKPIDFGNSIIAENWNPKETVQQNYRRLGLSAGLADATGGVEDKDNKVQGIKVRQNKIQTAKIVMGEDGNPKVEYAPQPENDIDTPFEKVEARTDVVRQLEKLASEKKSKPRQLSEEERSWLERLVAKHGDDYEAMQWDKKLNQFQHSAGELRRRIKKLN